MADEQRFQTGFIEAESDLPGLVQELDGTVWLVRPNGSRVQLPGGGGGGGTVIEQDTDPGAVGAGTFWVNTTDPGAGIPADVKPTLVRNAADDGWIEQGLIHYDDTGRLRSFVTLDDGSVVAEGFDAVGVGIGALAIYDDGGTIATFLRGKSTYLEQRDGTDVYFYLADRGFWFANAGVNQTWGISGPSGAEKFVSINEPDDIEVDANQRLHWYDGSDTALRFKQKDAFGVLSQGKSVGITDDGVMKLASLPTADPMVADQIWAAAGVLTLSGFTPGGGFTGWTEDASDPANVATNGGSLNIGSGHITDTDSIWTFGTDGLLGDNFTDSVQVLLGAVVVASDAGGVNAETYSMRVGHGIQSNPAAGQFAFKALGLAGGTVALDAGGLIVQNFGTLVPTSPPNLPAIPVPQDIADALVTLGLVTQS